MKKIFFSITVCVLYSICMVLATPSFAYAYLDPGSGSALFTTFIAIIATGLYSVKSLYYKLRGKNISEEGTDNNTLVIFSEGKSYWGTFEPIVNELIKQKIHFRYVSFDVFDPALTIESPFMHSKLYIDVPTKL